MGGRLAAQRADWDALAAVDPMWAVLGDPRLRHGGWEERRQEFFASGERELAAVLDTAAGLGLPRGSASALDFGCGLGRISRALAGRFGRVTAFDISPRMVARAREGAAGRDNLRFAVDAGDGLSGVADRSTDLVWCRLVLQHQPRRALALGYLRELVRVLAPGGLLHLQLPVRIPPRRRIEPRRRLYGLLRRLGLPAGLLYRRLGLHPVRMTAVPEREVERAVRAGGARIALRRRERHPSGVVDLVLYITR